MEESLSHFSEIQIAILAGNLLILITIQDSNNLWFSEDSGYCF